MVAVGGLLQSRTDQRVGAAAVDVLGVDVLGSDVLVLVPFIVPLVVFQALGMAVLGGVVLGSDGLGGDVLGVRARLLHPQHLEGIWIGQDQQRLPLAPLNEFPEPWC